MSTENQELQVTANSPAIMPSFGDTAQFDHAQRVAKMLAASSLIPKDYQNNIANTMIALELSHRMGASPLMVMQNLYIVQGKPAWSGSCIIGMLNACGRFTPIRFEKIGDDARAETFKCRAWATDKKTGDKIVGTWIDWPMIKGEGWLDKSGSKWKTLPEQMFQYRAGTFFGKLYAPDILMGIPSADEVEDFTAMISPNQEEMALQLLETSAYDEKKKQGIKWEITHECSAERAHLIINDLIANQPNPIDAGGNYNQGDIKRKQAQTLNL